METATQIATDFLMIVEAFRANPYLDTGGVWTIGYGTVYFPDGSHVTEHTSPITKEQAESYLVHTVSGLVSYIASLTHTPLTQHQIAALVSFTYNEGRGAFAESTLLKKINANDLDGALAEFPKWDKGHVDNKLTTIEGLAHRRVAEMALWRTPD